VTSLISETGALVQGFYHSNRSQLLSAEGEAVSLGNLLGSKDFVEMFLFAPAFDEQGKALASADVWVPQFRAQSDLVPVFAADVAGTCRPTQTTAWMTSTQPWKTSSQIVVRVCST